MKEYIKQIYSEGLADTFYLPVEKFFTKHIKNKKVSTIFKTSYKVLYTIVILLVFIYIIIYQFPF